MYIGVDLGTSSVKLILMKKDGTILSSVTRKYNIDYPKSGWSQQNPEDWLKESLIGISELLKDKDSSQIKGLGIGGQMHGLVILDKYDNVIRPAILWNDGRTDNQVKYLNEVIGHKKLSELTGNIAFAGFTAPKLMWIKEHEPHNYELINKIMLPKDYLVYMLTGIHSTDFSDASGTLLLDVKNKKWSKEMCNICRVKLEWLPKLFESFETVGNLKSKYSNSLGLQNVIVVAGAGDNAAAAIGTGTIGNGQCNISLGTSGTIFISNNNFKVDEFNSLHSFCHADGNFHLMACMLSAASCISWWLNILETNNYKIEINKASENLPKNNVYFLPYLMGERSPLNDTNARGAFIGMIANTTRYDMTLAVMEGVGFALRDSIEVAKKLDVNLLRSKICGGGAKNKLWIKILANILNLELDIPVVEEGPSIGAAMLAAVACGEYINLQEATKGIVHIKDTVSPEKELVNYYEKKYQKFKTLYPALKQSFFKISE